MVDVFHVFGVLDVLQTYFRCSPIQDGRIPQFVKPCGQDDMLSEVIWLVGHNFDLRVQIGELNCFLQTLNKEIHLERGKNGCPVENVLQYGKRCDKEQVLA